MSSRNSELLARAERAVPGGVSGGLPLPEGTDFVVERGRGARLWDVDGNEYVDFVLGSGPMILGHAHPAVIGAVSRAIERGTHFYLTTEPAVELAETIVEAAGGDGQVKFSSTGGEAIAYAIRLARAYNNRNKVLKFEGGYHGGQDALMLSVAPPAAGEGSRPIPDSAGITPGVQQDVLVARYNDLEGTARLLAQHAADLAAVIVEPGQRGINPKAGFLTGLRELTREHDTLLVFDEVVTGFRLGFGGAREHYGVQPDLAAYAKIIGGGYPLSAIWGRQEIMAAANPRRRDEGRVQVRGTLNGNPLAATAGLATIAQLRQPGVYQRLHELGAYLRGRLAEAGDRQGTPLGVVGEGPLAAIAFTSEPIVDYGSIARSDRARLQKVGAEMIRRGFLVNLDVKLYLSLAHTEADIDAAVEAFEAGIKVTA